MDTTAERQADVPGAGTAVEDIDGAFAPRPHPDVTGVEVGPEMVVVRGRPFLLNQTASLVWRCLDGEGTIDEIVADLADVTGADAAVVGRDVLELVRSLAATGLLDGIAQPVVEGPAVAWTPPTGVEVGVTLDDLTLPTPDGDPVALSDLAGRKVLLVNWSPGCGFCRKIAGELAELDAYLIKQGVTLAFVASGTAGANRELFEESGLDALILLRGGEPGSPDPFPGLGTPAAYLLDEHRVVAAPLAYGANEVPALARELAGVDEPPAPPAATALAEPTRARYLPAPAAVCGSGGGGGAAHGTDWIGTRAYRFGQFHVGVRYNLESTAVLLDRLFPGLAVDDRRAPENYSVALYPDGGRSRELNLLVRGGTQLARSRSAARVLAGLLGHLSAELGERDPGLLHLATTAAVGGGRAVLLPPGLLGWLKELQPRLARLGLSVVDLPTVAVDPAGPTLVVPDPTVAHDPAVLDELDGAARLGSEAPRVRPGLYPLTGWCVAAPGEPGGVVSPAVAVAAGVPLSASPPFASPESLAALTTLALALPATAVTVADPESLAAQLAEILGPTG